MMYANKMVASIKANGRILREHKETVYCPFGAEYSILLKNLNTVRALVNVYIDGDNVVPGGLVLNAGQEIDLQRAIKNNNLSEGNRFKFIERTGKIEQHRGVKLEDGLIRVEYQFERQWPATTAVAGLNNIYPHGGVLRGTTYDVHPLGSVSCSASYDVTSSSSATMDSYVPQNDTGITVPGSKSNQQFQTAYIGALEPQKYSIILKILGETAENEPVRKPITTKHKPKCVTCGKQNKATAKFCTECGTSLTLYA